MTTKPYVTPGAVSVWWVVLAPSKLSATGPIHQHDAVGRVRLLVFDNCEHVVDSVADLVEAILAASATVTILATSREGAGARLTDEFPDGVWLFDLAAVPIRPRCPTPWRRCWASSNISDEQLWRVPSLDVNSGAESAAVNLFVDRAQSVVSDFSLAQLGEADAVVEICRRLDGIPLAIELALADGVDDGQRGA